MPEDQEVADELYDLDKIAAKLEALYEEINDLNAGYNHRDPMDEICNDLASHVEASRMSLLKQVRRLYEKDEYSDYEYLG